MLNSKSPVGTTDEKSTKDDVTTSSPTCTKPLVSGSVYLFFRKNGFYPIELYDDADAIKNAEYNEGTIRVEDLSGRVVWQHCH